ncbi:hypothetical protein J7394_00115 [Ruegeria sp. R13_0]|uniref:hypothetical protein n=1 Tax=Ruegeria sp. R13_0 TaxID=2821099 RepID=UPI001ADB4C28|nr:hypothetical protein [Ruegeria sp. R13_0]MBO9432588.1 hypothetical protein [Ruegeria sp. R13_0]
MNFFEYYGVTEELGILVFSVSTGALLALFFEKVTIGPAGFEGMGSKVRRIVLWCAPIMMVASSVSFLPIFPREIYMKHPSQAEREFRILVDRNGRVVSGEDRTRNNTLETVSASGERGETLSGSTNVIYEAVDGRISPTSAWIKWVHTEPQKLTDKCWTERVMTYEINGGKLIPKTNKSTFETDRVKCTGKDLSLVEENYDIYWPLPFQN